MVSVPGTRPVKQKRSVRTLLLSEGKTELMVKMIDNTAFLLKKRQYIKNISCWKKKFDVDDKYDEADLNRDLEGSLEVSHAAVEGCGEKKSRLKKPGF